MRASFIRYRCVVPFGNAAFNASYSLSDSLGGCHSNESSESSFWSGFLDILKPSVLFSCLSILTTTNDQTPGVSWARLKRAGHQMRDRLR